MTDPAAPSDAPGDTGDGNAWPPDRDAPANPAKAVPPPIFLQRRSYRRRRMMDAARMLPVVGALLFLVPLLWPRPGGEEAPVVTSVSFIYVFGLWAVLILMSALLSRSARTWQDEEDREPAPGGGV